MFDPSVVARLRRGRFDAVVLFGWAHPTEWIAAAAARAARIPYLLYGDTDVRDGGTSGVPRVRRALLGRLLGGAAGALYTGTFNRAFYEGFAMDPERLWFSPWSVERERFAGGDRAAARTRLGLRDDVVYALFVGSLIQRKRPLALLHAVGRLQAAGARIGAIVAGSGPMADEVARGAARLEHAHLLGFVGQRELPDIYAAADLLVLPTARDPRATVVNEAMAAGLPVVITRGTGVWGPGDLVADGREGLVVAVDDPPALDDALRALHDDADRRRRMGAAASRRLETWNYDIAAAGWEAAVTAVVSR